MKPDQILALVTDSNKSLEKARSRRTTGRYIKEYSQVKDYVLMATRNFGMQSKTAARWIGPFVTVLAECLYAVEHISTKKRQEVSANPLRLYYDPSLNVEFGVEEQLASKEARVYEVEEIEVAQKRDPGVK
jgi:hypothetical protein